MFYFEMNESLSTVGLLAIIHEKSSYLMAVIVQFGSEISKIPHIVPRTRKERRVLLEIIVLIVAES
jgi:hypothetical protein